MVVAWLVPREAAADKTVHQFTVSLNSKQWVTTSFLQPVPYLVTPSVPQNCRLTSSFSVGAQTVARLLQTQIISDVCFITDHVVYASSNKTKIV